MYKITRLILERMKHKGLSRAVVIDALPFRNRAKAFRRFDTGVATGKFTKDLQDRLPAILGISSQEFNEALAETRDQQERENKAREAASWNARCARLRQEFRPHIQVKHQHAVPSPIFAVAISGTAHWKIVSLPENITDLPQDQQIETVRLAIVAHYTANSTASTPFGQITGYYYRQTYDRSIEFSTTGRVINLNSGRVDAGEAVISVKGKQVPFYIS